MVSRVPAVISSGTGPLAEHVSAELDHVLVACATLALVALATLGLSTLLIRTLAWLGSASVGVCLTKLAIRSSTGLAGGCVPALIVGGGGQDSLAQRTTIHTSVVTLILLTRTLLPKRC